MSLGTLQIMQRRTIHQYSRIARINPINKIGNNQGTAVQIWTRNFGHHGHGKGKIFEQWMNRDARWAKKHGKFGKFGNESSSSYNNGFEYGKRSFGHGCRHFSKYHGHGRKNIKDFLHMCRRHHGHYPGWRGGVWGGISFGSCLSIVISYTNYKSIVWAMIHGFLSWIYVIYYAFYQYNSQDKSANQLLNEQINEITHEIDTLNVIFKKLTSEVENAKEKNDNNRVSKGAVMTHDNMSSFSSIEGNDSSDNNDGSINEEINEFDEDSVALDKLKRRMDKLQRDVANLNDQKK